MRSYVALSGAAEYKVQPPGRLNGGDVGRTGAGGERGGKGGRRKSPRARSRRREPAATS